MSKGLRLPWRSFLPIAAAVVLAASFGASPLLAQSQQKGDPVLPGYPFQPKQSNPAAQTANTPQNATQSAPAQQQAPPSFTLPAGTLISVRTAGDLSSDTSHAGDTFTAQLAQPIVSSGWVVARRGQTVLGVVKVAKKAGHFEGQSKLGVALATLVLVDGRQLPIATRLMESSAPSGNAERAAATVGTTTGMGAVIGAAADWGEGAGIGAAIGAGAGIAGMLLTRGRPTVIPAESLLTFELTTPLTFSTGNSSAAFQPVTQADYAPAQPRLGRRPERVVQPPYPPPYDYPPYPYYYGPWGYAPGFYVGYYGGFYPGFGFGGWGRWDRH